MSFSADELYRLLPAVHRARDSEGGAAMARERGLPPEEGERMRPLHALIDALAGQVAVVEEHLEQLYDNHFVETAAPWALPYLGELLGIQGLPPLPALGGMVRAEVGHTMSYRQRKGTAAMLEQLARDATQWPARGVEFFERLATTQHVNHPRSANVAWASLRKADAMEFVGTAFEGAARTLEARRIAPGRGKWNIPNVGIFLWRLRTFSLTRSPLVPAEQGDTLRYHLDPLGRDIALLTRSRTEGEVDHLAEPQEVPLPITRRMLADHTDASPSKPLYSYPPNRTYYGPDASVMLWRINGQRIEEVPAGEIVVTDLTGWAPPGNDPEIAKKILLDPMLGRVLLPPGEEAYVDNGGRREPRLLASFYYGFSAELGGGEYNRAASLDRASLGEAITVSELPPAPGDTSPEFNELSKAIRELSAKRSVVRILDSGRYLCRGEEGHGQAAQGTGGGSRVERGSLCVAQPAGQHRRALAKWMPASKFAGHIGVKYTTSVFWVQKRKKQRGVEIGSSKQTQKPPGLPWVEAVVESSVGTQRSRR